MDFVTRGLMRRASSDLTAEASTLGWAPGFHLEIVEHNGKSFGLTATETDKEGEILAWIYRAADGTKLTVFND